MSGARGPITEPPALKKQKGTYNITRHKDEIAESSALTWVYNLDIPAPPEHLRPDAKDIWNKMLMQAAVLFGYISYIDLTVFEEYCYVYAEMEFLKNETNGSRTYIDQNTGAIRVHPLYLELNKIRKDWIRLSQEFGFSPSARTRIKLEQKKEVPVDEFRGF